MREATQRPRIIGHVARHSTAIPAREPAAENTDKKSKGQSKTNGKEKDEEKKKQQQKGTKANRAKGSHEHFWRGYKLHLAVADGQIPISAILTRASVHDSQLAIPLMAISSQRVTYCYELMDSAYDADPIHVESKDMDHVPIIAPHPRRGTKNPSQLQKVFPDKPAPELTPAQQARFKERTMVERVNARLQPFAVAEV